MSALARKLLLKPGRSVLLLNAPEGYAQSLVPLPEGARIITEPGEQADVTQLFVRDSADLARQADTAMRAVKRDGVLWICYLKGGAKAGTDLNRDILHAAVERTYGWTGVSLVAVDDRWSAMRFRRGESGTK
jgi:hypothetical protein